MIPRTVANVPDEIDLVDEEDKLITTLDFSDTFVKMIVVNTAKREHTSLHEAGQRIVNRAIRAYVRKHKAEAAA